LERKLTAILCADVYGYSRLMGEDEEGTLRTLSAYRKITDSRIERHHGRFVNSAGDSILAEFASVVEAVTCAVAIQTALRAENEELALQRRMQFRIGVNLGDVMVEGEQIYGDGVNVAARLESLADPGGICVSGTVHEQVRDKLTLTYEDRGEQEVKNIARSVRVWRVVLNEAAPSGEEMRGRTRRYWRGGVLSLAGVAIIAATFMLVQHMSFRPQQSHASIPAPPKPALSLPSIPSIAVLPFTNLSGDPRQEYFSDGISNQLIEDLSRLPGLFVIARNSSFAYKGKTTNEREIGRELGVKYLLEGSVRKAADRIRIGVQLVDASSGRELWTERFDRPLYNIFALQDELVGKVVTTLGLIFKLGRLNRWTGAPIASSTDNLEAFDDYLRAYAYVQGSDDQYARQDSAWIRDNEMKAQRWLEKAIALDPNFAQAYALLAFTFVMQAWNDWSANPQADLEHSRQLALKALALDDANVNALRWLSNVYLIQGRLDQAVVEAERAVAINPNFAPGYEQLSMALLVAANRPEAALRAGERAARLDPVREDYYAYLVGDALVEQNRYQEGISVLKRHLKGYPDNIIAHAFLLVAYSELGHEQEARTEAAEVMRINPRFTLASIEQGVRLHPRWLIDERKAGLK
jgi:adenylate cyclase